MPTKTEKEEGDLFAFPRRALTIATIVFTLILILIVASMAWGMVQMQWTIGAPTSGLEGENFVIAIPLNITNRGVYDVHDFQITTCVYDQRLLLINATSTIPIIKGGTSSSMAHNLTLNLKEFLAEHSQYLFNNTEFTILDGVSLNFAGVIPLGINLNNTMSWGAPLSNLDISQPTFTVLNYTHVRVEANLHFSNYASFPISGTLELDAYHDSEKLSQYSYSVEVSPGADCNAALNLIVPTYPPVTRVVLVLKTDYFSWEMPIYG